MKNNICCIGAGYIGGPTMSVMALHNPDCVFHVVDLDEKKIDAWNSDNLPIYEPNLKKVVEQVRGVNLFFSTDIKDAIERSDIIFIGVNTPTKTMGEGAGKASDLTYWEGASKTIAKYANSDKIVVEKSTLPVKTSESICRLLKRLSKHNFKIVSNPEFLAEGTAINDLQFPNRVLIGGSDIETIRQVSKLYEAWVPKDRIITTDCFTAELSKLAANATLAQRVSTINSFAEVCEKVGANINDLEKVLKSDDRIGSKFLSSGVGFGGSCFKKDILSLIYICESLGLQEVADYWQAVLDMNSHQVDRIVNRVLDRNFNTLRGKKIGVLGYAFKPNSGDVRETQSKYVIKQLMGEGAIVLVTDPKAKEGFISDFGVDNANPIWVDDVEELLKSVDDYIVMTKWSEYDKYDI